MTKLFTYTVQKTVENVKLQQKQLMFLISKNLMNISCGPDKKQPPKAINDPHPILSAAITRSDKLKTILEDREKGNADPNDSSQDELYQNTSEKKTSLNRFARGFSIKSKKKF